MYEINIALSEKEIIEFEKLRNIVFHGTKPIEKKTDSPYAQAIEKGDILAFCCLEDQTLVGGMLIRLLNNNIELMRMFVDESKREQGTGSFMISYLESHQGMLEDYFGVEHIDGCVLSPIKSRIDYWHGKGYDFMGCQMYKRFEKTKRNK
ncbi:MAG: GNAT family N-acetyltransferase [Bacilli bacterium]|nr:GNAT family N-acetyltransferase [Bacilli bacterium]